MILAIGLLIATLIFLGLSFFFSGSEMAVYSVNRFRLESQKEDGDKMAGKLLHMLDRSQRLMVMTLVGTIMANVLTTLCFEKLLLTVFSGLRDKTVLGMMGAGELISMVILTPIIVLFAESLPKAFFRAHADAFFRRFHLLYEFFTFLFFIPIRAIEALTNLMPSELTGERSRLMRRVTRQDVINLVAEDSPPAAQARTDEEVASVAEAVEDALAAAAATGENSSEVNEATRSEMRMVQSILGLDDTRAREIMTPLVELVAIDLTKFDIEGLKTIADASGFSRFPVYRFRVVDMIGYVDINRVLREEREGMRLEDFIEPGYYIPETMCVDDLLRDFLSQRVKTAIVVDEYGGCAGWITREDILEEIVGELEDELDVPTSMISETEPGIYLIDGRTEIDMVNEQLGSVFGEDEWDTMAGLVLNSAGRIPAEGDTFAIQGWDIKVLRMEHRRISQVEARRQTSPPPESPTA